MATEASTKPPNRSPRSKKGKQVHVDSIAKVTQKSGIVVPKNWPTGLYFVGDINVLSWPGPDKLQEFYLTHSVTVNSKVFLAISPKNRGLGLFAAQKLRKGQVVGYYSGHLRKQQVKHDSEYVANWRPVGEKFDGEWEIDAEYGGNEMRFANYPNDDEEPNMKANCIRRNNLQVIAFKATRDVKKGTELLWHYGPDYLEEEENNEVIDLC